MSSKKLFGLIALLTILSTVVAACGGGATPAPATQALAPAATQPPAPAATQPPAPTAKPPEPTATPKPVTFVMCEPGDAVRLDPADYDDGQTAARAEQIFETLVEFDGATTNVRPALAEKWDTSADGKTWTFYLRKGVKFHDGTPFNADAVIWNYTRQWDETHPYHTKDYSTLTWEYWHDVIGWGFKGEKGALMQDIQKVDDYTVKFVMTDASGPFLINMALFSNGIVSPASFDKNKTDAFKNPVGTGPFKFVEWIKDDHITLQKNPDWWGGANTVALDRLIFRVIKDNSARYLAVKAGDCNGMGEGANPDDAKAAASDPNLQVLSRPPLNVGYLAFNQAAKPLDNLKVRQAIAWAVNKKAIVDALYAGNGVMATQYLPQSLWGWNPDIKQTCCDAEKAKALLKDAGFEKGFTIDFWYMPVSRPYYPDPKAIAQAIAADLAKVGITTNLKTEDWGQYKVDARDGKFNGMWLLGWTGDNGDPDNFLFTFFGDSPPGAGASTKCCAYYNKDLNDLLSKAVRLSDIKAREPLYKQAAVLIDADMPRVAVAHSTVPLIFSKKVSGYIPNPVGTEFFKTVKLAP
jgi:peptide/nickel transport system substrate-binding protein